MEILAATEKYVTGLFKTSTDESLVYHNLDHTKSVVQAAKFIGEQCGLNGDGSMETLLLAAWFHDLGYLVSKTNHEDASKELAAKFLKSQDVKPDVISQVERCIEATRIPQKPQDKLSAILCDADLFHFSQENFIESSQVYWDELYALTRQKLDKAKYLEITLRFLNLHTFKSEYGKTILEQGKALNLAKIKKSLIKARQVS